MKYLKEKINYNTIGTKFYLFTFLTMIVTVLVLTSLSIYFQVKIMRASLTNVDNSLNEQYQKLLKSEVETIVSQLDSLYTQVKNNDLEIDIAKKIGENIIRAARFSKNEYFFVDDLNGVNIVLLGSEKEGKSRLDLTDSNGVKIVQEFINIAKTQGSGFLKYYFPKNGETIPYPKLSYVQKYEPFGWIIGTGIYIDEINEKIEKERDFIKSIVDKGFNITILISIIVFVVFTIIMTLFIKSLNKRLNTIHEILQKTLNFDYSEDDKYIVQISTFKDETKIIGEIIINMRKTFRDLILSIINNLNDIKSVSKHLSDISEQSFSTITDISNAIESIAQGATAQATSTMNAANDTNKISNVVKDNYKILSELLNCSKNIENAKNESNSELLNLIKISNDAKNGINNVYDVINLTNISAQKIENASTMIQSISDQTNLLALNAAIEAARAGEQGKGFAVVAEEIRKLAEDSNKFTDEIKLVISELKKDSNYSVDLISKIKEMVDYQNIALSQTNEKFNDISLEIDNTNIIINDLEKSGNELEAMNNDLASIVEDLSAISEENAAATEQVAASSQEQVNSNKNITKESENLNHIINDLNNKINVFKI